VFREALYALALALVFAIESLGVELIPQAQSLDLAMQPGQVCFCRCGKIKPVFSGGLALELRMRREPKFTGRRKGSRFDAAF
jgi:hypothetical protein